MSEKQKNYTTEILQQALDSIRDGMSFGEASREFKITKSTLVDKIHNKYEQGTTSGAHCVLTAAEEQTVVDWILYLETIGFPVTKNQLLGCVAELVRRLERANKFKHGIPGRHWYENFFARHPELSHRVCQNLTKPRANITEKSVRGWFDRVSEYLKTNNLEEILSDPKRIFNCDESAFFLSPKEKCVIVRKGSKKVYTRIANDEKECLTVLLTMSAEGQVVKPTVLFPYKRVPASIHLKMPLGWGIGHSDSGWMTGECFYEFITNVFYKKWIVEKNVPLPVVLFLDGHSSHLTLHLTEFCKSKGIILIALLPNSTHILQPLDVAIFRPLKLSWKNRIHNWSIENNGKKLKREDFAEEPDKCIRVSVTEDTVRNGFRTCGLFPYNQNNFDFSKLPCSS
ncbi:uncharacterized protein [Diabrotica undecimpunctata]|uniref:uncharacterized protein n=1 Tax=Diabrotica undecimpunctata TaxID=50387 RepID=UPI003B63AB5A